MCFVSMITDAYGTGGKPWSPAPFPDPVPQPINPVPPITPGVAPIIPWQTQQVVVHKWDREALDMLRAVLAMLKKLDAKLGLADCEDPKKAEWMKEIERQVAVAEHDEWGRKR